MRLGHGGFVGEGGRGWREVRHDEPVFGGIDTANGFAVRIERDGHRHQFGREVGRVAVFGERLFQQVVDIDGLRAGVCHGREEGRLVGRPAI